MTAMNANRGRGALAAMLLALLAITTSVSSFGIVQPTSRHRSILQPSTIASSSSAAASSTRLSAVPAPERYDTTYKAKPPTFNKSLNLWEPSPETEAQPYGPWGSFLRGGPTPFVLRLLQPSEYDQAVFKYMAQTKCSRIEAQGNMDAFFNNAADWAYQKSEEARGRPKVDYTELKPQQAALVITWAVFVTPFLGRCAYLIAFGGKGWDIMLDDVFNF